MRVPALLPNFFLVATKGRRQVRRPTRDQVRAWLSTVIGPMIDSLKIETRRAGEASWSFRASRQDFEFLWPTEMMLAEPYLPNLQQYLRNDPRAGRLVATHDDSLNSLRAACRTAFELLVAHPALKQLSADQPDDARKYFAEYVLNGARDLPFDYIHAEYWARSGERFLDLRKDPGIRRAIEGVEQAGRAFGDAARLLLSHLTTVRDQLADKYGLAVVEPGLSEPAGSRYGDLA